MAVIPSVTFAPDLDNAWSVNPGALTSINGFAPLQSGAYGSVGTANYFGSSTITGDYIYGKMFRQINGSVRLLLGTGSAIDEYDSSATKTNRVTALSTGASWSMAAWGNQIIACNYVAATQSSTGAGFSGLGGGCPKARLIAANINFVMLADTDDGSTPYADEVWWSALRDPTSWTVSAATQAGRIRLLDSPGPIRALIAYRDMFVAFKDNAMFVGSYEGSPFFFTWRMVSARIGCVGRDAVTEVDGKLYFLHTSGFYEFDGQSLRNVGLPVFQSFLADTGFTAISTGGDAGIGSSWVATVLSETQTAGDDIEGCVWFMNTNTGVPSNVRFFSYCYNCRSGKWGRYTSGALFYTLATRPALYIKATTSDLQAFKTDTAARVLMLQTNTVPTTTVQSIRYPYASDSNIGCSLTTGVYGGDVKSQKHGNIRFRTLYPSESATVTGNVTGYETENKLSPSSPTTVTGAYNAEFDRLDAHCNMRYMQASVAWPTGKKVILGGIGAEQTGETRR